MECCICLEIKTDNFTGKCKHSVCKDCYLNLNKFICPMCRMTWKKPKMKLKKGEFYKCSFKLNLGLSGFKEFNDVVIQVLETKNSYYKLNIYQGENNENIEIDEKKENIIILKLNKVDKTVYEPIFNRYTFNKKTFDINVFNRIPISYTRREHRYNPETGTIDLVDVSINVLTFVTLPPYIF